MSVHAESTIAALLDFVDDAIAPDEMDKETALYVLEEVMSGLESRVDCLKQEIDAGEP